jgi:hypothetical protein
MWGRDRRIHRLQAGRQFYKNGQQRYRTVRRFVLRRSQRKLMRNSIAIGVAHLDTVVLVMAFSRKRGEEQLTMCVGMLARRLIVGELHADFVAYALAPEIPVEVIVGHAKLPKQKNDREERSRCPSSGRYLARNAAFYRQARFRSCSTTP